MCYKYSKRNIASLPKSKQSSEENMRKIFDPQMTFGQTPIDEIEFDLRCRDEIPKLLMGLQHVYKNKDLREKVFDLLEKMIPENTDSKNGRPGMDLWKIFVLGTLRLNCNWDFDKLHDISNNHKTVRQMMGHGILNDDRIYPLQTLKDNVSLLTPEILDEINKLIVDEGHNLLSKKDQPLTGRCDSFVLETNVHFPTDINLLFDAIRKLIMVAALLTQKMDITIWRQYLHNIRTFKKLYRIVQKLKRSTSKNEKKKEEREQEIIEAHEEYIDAAEIYIKKAEVTIDFISSNDPEILKQIEELKGYMAHATRQIDQIRRRVVDGEKIPHEEKVFSIFEPHTEWISKGKAGVPQELGIRVCILEDQYGFILHHRVMEKETDDKIAVPMVAAAQKKFPNLQGCSFDKGFYTPSNKERLKEMLSDVVLPKKGKRNKAEHDEETSQEFVQAKRKHSAVESAINALENHGLDRCPDHGIDGFKRYVALSVAARNLQIIGHHLQQKQLKKLQRLRADD